MKNVPTKMPIPDNDFYPGMIYLKDKRPFGVIDDIKAGLDDSTQVTNKVTVWDQLFCGKTDKFHKCNISFGQLYATVDGFFTTEPDLGVKAPAIIIDKHNDIIEFIWLGSE